MLAIRISKEAARPIKKPCYRRGTSITGPTSLDNLLEGQFQGELELKRNIDASVSKHPVAGEVRVDGSALTNADVKTRQKTFEKQKN